MLGAVLTFAVVLAQAAPASAPAATQSEAPAAAKPAAGKDLSGVTVTGRKTARDDVDPKEVICHSELPIGSRFAVKVCARREDVAERRFVDQMEVRRMTALRPGSGN
jgi:hypothetical protein